MKFYRFQAIPMALAIVLQCAGESTAQVPVRSGSGSYASAPPYYKAKTETGSPGFNATAMLSREIFVDELPSVHFDGVEAPGRPIPTNDWWTDIINNRFSGALWSYPAMLKTSTYGVEVYWPSYWADSGKEIKSRSHLTVSASRSRAASAIAADGTTGTWCSVCRRPRATERCV